ncbi:MAG TPA: aminotransferase class V-fold PLP-dependent enzyme [Gemmatimonadales bacterium]|nr:aminotransferase class V-fold PLP-dependent enzyme [Gemmatimonadales bacterium]
MSGRHHLFVPGPSNIPDRVLRAMHRASEDHRSVAFPHLVLPLLRDTARLLGAEPDRVALFMASGTGGWEVALTNTLPPGAQVLLPCAGHFANLWGDSARRLGFAVETVPEMEWGDAPSPERIASILAADTHHRFAAILVVHNETSTGVTADLPAIRAAIDKAGHPALLMIDGVSSIGSLEYRHDDWRVDVAITGSQKGLMLPAGLAIVAFSERALAAANTVTGPRAYFDLRPMLAQNADGYFPYTPSIPMLYGLRESVGMLLDEGLDQVAQRHARLARGVRAAVAAWRLPICCRNAASTSNTVTTIMTPAGIDARKIVSHAFTKYDLSLGGGLGPLAGKAFRIGHMGWLNEGMLFGALGLTAMALTDCGVPASAADACAAAAAVWHGDAS